MKNLPNLLITLSSLLLITTITILYSEGWRIGLIDFEDGRAQPVIKRTGMLAVRSIPDGAKVYIDGDPVTATDDTITSLTPQRYNIRVIREGFEVWEKDVDVYPELVTDITAVLVLQSPRLEPLTNTNVKAYGLSSNHNNIAFLTQNHQEPGVWLMPLTGSPLNIFRNNTRIMIPDTTQHTPSFGEQIWWSPNDRELLIRMNETGYLLYQIDGIQNANLTPTSTTNVDSIRERWDLAWRDSFLINKITNISETQEIPEWIASVAINETTTWSPDDEKFFFILPDESNPNEHKLFVYNSEEPLPIGEKRIYETLRMSDIERTSIYWYSDSYHLVLVEQNPNAEEFYTISLVRIDGTNKTTIYTGALASNQAYPTPTGDKIIVLTWLKERNQTNLYAISIR